MSDIREKFNAAVEVIKNLPKNQTYQPSNELMLRFYSLYKQAVFGNCNISRPGFWDVVGRAKWDAWNSMRAMSSNQAMLLYVEELKKVIETMPHSIEVGNFIQTLGSFYEIVDENTQEENYELNSYQHVELKPSSSCESVSDKGSETSFYEVAPTFFGDFDALETIKRLQDDVESISQRVAGLEVSIRSQSERCICRMFMTMIPPIRALGIPLAVGLSIVLSPLIWILLVRIIRIVRRVKQIKLSD